MRGLTVAVIILAAVILVSTMWYTQTYGLKSQPSLRPSPIINQTQFTIPSATPNTTPSPTANPKPTPGPIPPGTSARMIGFRQKEGPVTVVFYASSYNFRISIENTGNITLSDAVLYVNVTCSNGDTADLWSAQIESIDAGVAQTVMGSIIVHNFVGNLYFVDLTWVFTLEVNQRVIAQSTFYS